MNCELAEETILDMARGIDVDAELRAAVASHASNCSACAMRMTEEAALTQRLRALAVSSERRSAGDSVEPAVLAAFRAVRDLKPPPKQGSQKLRWAGVAIAAGLALAVLWMPRKTAVRQADVPVVVPRLAENQKAANPLPAKVAAVRKRKTRKTIPRVKEPGSLDQSAPRFATEFFALPHAPAFSPEDGVQLVRVRLPRSSLRSFGLLMDESRTAGRVQADVLLGQDGIARAVRFVQ